MKKQTNKKLINTLKPFWSKYKKLEYGFFKKTRELENEMNKKISLGFNLEFFSCDGEVVGIGAESYEKRANFPLIQDSELDN